MADPGPVPGPEDPLPGLRAELDQTIAMMPELARLTVAYFGAFRGEGLQTRQRGGGLTFIVVAVALLPALLLWLIVCETRQTRAKVEETHRRRRARALPPSARRWWDWDCEQDLPRSV